MIEFLYRDSLKNIILFENTFLLANTNMEVVLENFFITLSNASHKFVEPRKLVQK